MRGCFLGAALGSALACRVEALPPAERASTIEALEGGESLPISGDAVLFLYTAEGLLRALVRFSDRGICSPPDIVFRAYERGLERQGAISGAEWLGDEGWLVEVAALHQPRRADPETVEVLTARAERREGGGDREHFQGPGALVRIAPVGLFADDPFGLAREISEKTHRDVTAGLASAFFAQFISFLGEGMSIEESIAKGRECLEPIHTADWALMAIDRASKAAEGARFDGKIEEGASSLGTAESATEVLTIALYCLLVTGDFREAMRLALSHRGNIEAVAMLVGAALGAMQTASALPPEWVEGLELRAELETVAEDLHRAASEDLSTRAWWDRYPGC